MRCQNVTGNTAPGKVDQLPPQGNPVRRNPNDDGNKPTHDPRIKEIHKQNWLASWQNNRISTA